MVAVGDSDQEGVGYRNRVDLHVNVEFNVPAVLLVGIGDKMNAGDISEGGLVIWVDFVDFEPVFKNLAVHQLGYYYRR